VFLSFVDPLLVQRHLGDQAVGSTEVARLLRHRAIPAGMPVFLDEGSMRPAEAVVLLVRHVAYEDKFAKTLREYAYIIESGRRARFTPART
jgi:hypothetical protein